MTDLPTVLVLTPLAPERLTDMHEFCRPVEAKNVESVPPATRRECQAVVLRSECRLDRSVLDELPRLRHVIRAGSGTDNIDLAELSRRGIMLSRNPAVSAVAVAELALGGLTMLCRRVPLGHAMLRLGLYAKEALIGDELTSLRLVVWGAGPVGQAVARRAREDGMDVRFAAHRSVPRDWPQVPGEVARLEADAHVIALPLHTGTVGMVNGNWLRGTLPRRPYLVDVSRFGITDLAAVEMALMADELRGFYLDPIDARHAKDVSAFLQRVECANVLVTQHQGAQRADVRAELDRWVIETLRGSCSARSETCRPTSPG